MPTVMIVEDDPSNAYLLESLCQMNGYDAVVVNTAEDALQQLPHIMPDLVFIDIRLPKMNGFELGHLICNDSRTTHIPLIAISANNDLLSKQNLHYGGFAHAFPKPLNIGKLGNFLQKKIQAQT